MATVVLLYSCTRCTPLLQLYCCTVVLLYSCTQLLQVQSAAAIVQLYTCTAVQMQSAPIVVLLYIHSQLLHMQSVATVLQLYSYTQQPHSCTALLSWYNEPHIIALHQTVLDCIGLYYKLCIILHELNCNGPQYTALHCMAGRQCRLAVQCLLDPICNNVYSCLHCTLL